MPKTLAALMMGAASLMTLPATAYAETAGGGSTAGDIKQICEKEKVQKCRWEGDRHICEWVDGPNCLVTRTAPGGRLWNTPGKLLRQ